MTQMLCALFDKYKRLTVLIAGILLSFNCTHTIIASARTGVAKPPRSAPTSPFLCLPFKASTVPRISQGWIYSPEETSIHGIKNHFAIDFATASGTPIYSASDGWAVSSVHINYSGKRYKGKRFSYAFGRFVQVMHRDNNGEWLYTQYGHLSKVAPNIPTFDPIQRGDNWDPDEIYQPYSVIPPASKWIERGTLLGYVGTSGLAWDDQKETPINAGTLQSWDIPHLHFEVFRRDEKGRKSQYFDPFGILSGDLARYNSALKGPATGLWLPDPNRGGNILYAQ